MAKRLSGEAGNAKALKAQADELQRAHDQAIALFGEGLPDDRAALVDQTRYFMGCAAVAGIQAGRRLAVLRLQCQRGEWLPLLDELGIAKSTAHRWITISERFYSNKQLRALGTGKLIALLDFDEGDIVEADDGVYIAGTPLDEIDTMSAREVKALAREQKTKAGRDRKRIRKLQGDIEARDEQIETLRKGPRNGELLERLQQHSASVHGTAHILVNLCSDAKRRPMDQAAIAGCALGMLRELEMAVDRVCALTGTEMDSPMGFARNTLAHLGFDLGDRAHRKLIADTLGVDLGAE